MLTWILLIIVLIALVVLGTWVFGRIFGRGELLPPMDETHHVIAANREAVAQGRFDDIALEVVPRGYRQDQVDALIEQLLQRSSESVRENVAASADEKSLPHFDKKG